MQVNRTAVSDRWAGLIVTVATTFLVVLLTAASAQAAECTNTWKGPVEGEWATVANWSAGHVPNESDVACIGSGKTARVKASATVGVVQGQGSVEVAGTSVFSVTNSTTASKLSVLAIAKSATLTGPGNVEVSSAFYWLGEGKLSGTGSITVLPGATATKGLVEGTGSLVGRRLVNEGSLTLAAGNSSFSMSEGAELVNKGIVSIETGTVVTIAAGSGSSSIINTGIFQKVAVAVSENVIQVPFHNEGTAKVTVNTKLAFTGGGTAGPLSKWETSGNGWIKFGGGSFALSGGTFEGQFFVWGAGTSAVMGGVNTASASINLEKGAALSLSGGSASMDILSIVNGSKATIAGHLTTRLLGLFNGILSGTGTVDVDKELIWEGNGTMSGSGSTILAPGSKSTKTDTVAFAGKGILDERHLVNEGTFTLESIGVEMSKGAVLTNRGTFKANGVNFVSIYAGEGGSSIVNTGSFQKTAGNTGKNAIEPAFTNFGSIFVSTKAPLNFLNPVTQAPDTPTPHHSKCGDPVDCATGNFSETQTDLEIGGLGVGLGLTRTYSAQAAAASSLGIFGYGWTNSFGDRLVVEEAGKRITLTDAAGGTVPFIQSGATYLAPSWTQDVLSGSTETGFTLTLPNQVKQKFSGSGRLESAADRNGNQTTLAYSGSGKLETITDPVGREITLSYNAEGLVEKVEDPMGHVVKYAYEGKSLKAVTTPGEATPRWQFKYDGSRRMTQITDGRSGKTTNEFDGSSRVISQADPASRTLAFKYEAFHTTITNKVTGAVTDEWFNSNNQPYSITRGFGTSVATTETFTYNASGRLASRTDGAGHTTSYGYDAQGNRTSEKDAAGEEAKWAFNSRHDLISSTAPGGETTTIERDANGNALSVSRPGPEATTQTTSFTYGESGELESATDPLERTWTYSYDAYGDRTSETDPLGNAETFAYDEDSRLVSVVTPRGNAEGAEPSEYETTIERDSQGRPVAVTDPLGHETEYSYDGNGNLASETDAGGHTTKFTYNAVDQQTKVEKPNGAVFETSYDGAGAVTSQTDANKHTTTFVRNLLEQPVEIKDPLGRVTKEEFDAAGNLKAVIDSAERKTSYSYDLGGRVSAIDYSEAATPDVGFGYDANGQMTSMVDGIGESSFEYDPLGRLVRSEDGLGEVVEYGYDLADELTSILYPNGETVSRTYDGAGRLESVSDWLGGTTRFAYTPDSQLEAIAFPSGTYEVDEYAYDRAGRMSGAIFAQGPESLASLSYNRDKLGQVEAETRKGLPGPEETAYGYDANHRLTSAGGASFEYDLADNLTKAPGTTNIYDAASQLESGTGIAYSYDSLGQRIKATPASGPATTYGYDQAGDLVSIERPEEGEVPAIGETLAYDGTGLLASRTSGLATSQLTWDQSAELPVLLDDGQSSYIYGPNGQPIEQISSAEAPTYLHHDQLGSTRLLTDASGEASAAFSYASYGMLEGSTGSVTTPLGFAGQYTDVESGLQYLRARFYDSSTAQFLTRDPIEDITRSPYGYAGENPVSRIDPSGLCGASSVGSFLESINPISEENCAFQAASSISGAVSSTPLPSTREVAEAEVGFFDGGTAGFTKYMRDLIGIGNGGLALCGSTYEVSSITGTAAFSVLAPYGPEAALQVASRFPRASMWLARHGDEVTQIKDLIEEVITRFVGGK